MQNLNYSQSLFRLIIQNLAEEVCSVLSFKSQFYGIGLSYIFNIVVQTKSRLDLCDPPLYQRKACLTWEHHNMERFIHGVITCLKTFGRHQEAFLYSITLSSPLHALVFSKASRTFVYQSADEIIQEMLSEHFNRHEYSFVLTKSYKNIPFIAQYQLMNFAFMRYLCGRYGLWFLFEQQSMFARLRFYDDIEKLNLPIITIPFQESAGLVESPDIVFSFQQTVHNYPQAISLRDYNPQTPDLDLYAGSFYKGTYPAFGHVEQYGLGVDDILEAQQLTQQIQMSLNCQREVTVLKTNHLGLELGQVIHLKDHPGDEFNKAYRIIRIKHQADQASYGMRYQNSCCLIPVEMPFYPPYFDLLPLNFPILAKTIGQNSGESNLDSQGRYQIQFYFDTAKRVSPPIRRIHLYGGPTKQQVYGSHFPLRDDVDVAVGFEDGKPDRPIILGVMPNDESPPSVTAKNASQYRLRSYGGNEIVLDDRQDSESIDLHTTKVEQQLLLSAKKDEEHISLLNRTGEMKIQSAKDIKFNCKEDSMTTVKQDSLFQIKENYTAASDKEIKIFSGDALMIDAEKEVSFKTEKGDISIQGDCGITLDGKRVIDLSAENGDIVIQAEELTIKTPELNMVCPGKIDIGSGLVIEKGGVNFSNASFVAPSIVKQPPASTKEAQAKQGKSAKFLNKTEKEQLEKDHLFPLIGINCRQDAAKRDYFKSEKKEPDPYWPKSSTPLLNAKQLQYFATNHIPKKPKPNQAKNPPNVTIFIHGYNVDYGEFGLPVSVDDNKKESFKNRFFSRLDICRDSSLLNRIAWDYPDAKIKKELINPGLQIIHHEEIVHIVSKEKDAAASAGVSDKMVNGEGAHNWWLYMERNLNIATQQLEEKDYSNYTRFLHIAWQGDPASPLDYMAAVERATQTAKFLVPLIDQLRKQGLEINIIAHSLGCQLLLKLMDLLGSKPSYHECLNCVFMWQAAIPNDVFSRHSPELANDKYLDHTVYSAPNAVKAVKKIIVLYSHYDNILGSVPPKEDLKFWTKLFHPSGGISLALLVGAIHLINSSKIPRRLQSIYYVAHIFGRPFHDFLKNKQIRRDFYYNWIKNHTEILEVIGEGKDKKYKTKPFAASLREQSINIRHQFPKIYRYLSVLLQGVIDNKIAKALTKASYIFFEGYNYSSAGITKKFFHYLNEKIINPIDDSDLNFTPANEMAVLLITVFISDGPMPRPALGYEGLPQKGNFRNYSRDSKKLAPVNQRDLLGGHSMMKNPTPELLEKIYHDQIFRQRGYHFGAYDPKKEKHDGKA